MLELSIAIPDLRETGDEQADILIREFMHDVAEYLSDSFERHVPFDRGGMFSAITESRINKTPYGYTVDVGIEPVMGAEDPNYPLYVHEGTGVFAGNDFIRPQHGNVIAFEKQTGETVFTTRVVGQPPQPFINDVERETNAFIETRLRELGVVLSTVL